MRPAWRPGGFRRPGGPGPLARTFGASVPHDCNRIDVHFAAQATVLGGSVRASSGVAGTVGTF